MQVVLPNVRLAFPDLWRPGEPMAGSTSGPKYGGTGIFAPNSEAGRIAQEAFVAVARAKWGDAAMAVIQSIERTKKCIRDGNLNLDKAGQVRQGFAGMLYIVAKNKIKPHIVDAQFVDGKPVHLTEEMGRIYAGCNVNLSVDIYASDKPGQGKQIGAQLLAVQFHSDNEAFGGGVGNPDVFAGLSNPGSSAFANLGASTAAPNPFAPAGDPAAAMFG